MAPGRRRQNGPSGAGGPITPGSLVLANLSSPDPSAKPIEKPDPVRLQIRFTPGFYDLTESMGMRMNVLISGGSMRLGMSNDTTIGGDVQIDPPDAAGETRLTFACRSVRAKMDVDAPQLPQGKHMSYDSALTPDYQDPSLAAMLRPMVGWEGHMWARGGKFTRVDGVTELMQNIRWNAPPEAQQMMAGFEKQMGDFMKEMLTQHWGELIPDKPIAPGDRWKGQLRVTSVPMIGEMTIDCECMLHRIEQGAKGKLAVIGFTATSTLRDRTVDLSSMAPGAGAARIETLTLSESGAFYFDTALGLSTRVGMEGRASGTMTVEAAGQQARVNLNVEMKAKNVLDPIAPASGPSRCRRTRSRRRTPGTSPPPRTAAARQPSPYPPTKRKFSPKRRPVPPNRWSRTSSRIGQSPRPRRPYSRQPSSNRSSRSNPRRSRVNPRLSANRSPKRSGWSGTSKSL